MLRGLADVAIVRSNVLVREKSSLVEDRVDRRLAAILAADIAGYSRLMGTDDEGTLRLLKAYRKELVDPKIG